MASNSTIERELPTATPEEVADTVEQIAEDLETLSEEEDYVRVTLNGVDADQYEANEALRELVANRGSSGE